MTGRVKVKYTLSYTSQYIFIFLATVTWVLLFPANLYFQVKQLSTSGQTKHQTSANNDSVNSHSELN